MAYQSNYLKRKYGNKEDNTTSASSSTRYRSNYFKEGKQTEVKERTPVKVEQIKIVPSVSTVKSTIKTNTINPLSTSAARQEKIVKTAVDRAEASKTTKVPTTTTKIQPITTQSARQEQIALKTGKPLSPAKEMTDKPLTSAEISTRVDSLNNQIEALRKEKAEKTGNRLKTGLTVAQSQKLAKEYDAQIADLEAQRDALSTQFYVLENEEKQTAKNADAKVSVIYDAAKTAQSDLAKVSALINKYFTAEYSVYGTGLTPAENAELKEYKAYLMKKYGLDESAFKMAPDVAGAGHRSLQELYNELSDQIKQAQEVLSKQGYDYERMTGYEGMLEKAKEYEAETKRIEGLAKEMPVSGSIASVIAAPMQGADYARLALGNIGHNDSSDLKNYIPLNVYDMDATNLVTTIRETVSKEIEEKTNWEIAGQNVASFLYQTGMSIADSASQIALFGTLGTYVMGASAAAQTAKESIERGATNNQALAMGLAAGAAEAIFEKFSVENLLAKKNITGVLSALKETAKQAGVEASEEAFTEIANILTDTVIMADKSNFNQMVSDYQKQGMSAEEAKKQAFLDLLGQVGWATVGGAISGGIMGGGVSLYRGAVQSATAKGPNTPNTISNPLDQQAQVVQQVNPEATVLDAATTLFVQQGMNLKTAQTRADIIRRLMEGDETVTNLEINKLEPTSKVSQQTFTQLTGVQFPEGKLTTKQLYEIYRSAHTAAQTTNNAPVMPEVIPTAKPVQAPVQEPQRTIPAAIEPITLPNEVQEAAPVAPEVPQAEGMTVAEQETNAVQDEKLAPEQARVVNIMVSNIISEARKQQVPLEAFYAATEGIDAFNPTTTDIPTLVAALQPVVDAIGNDTLTSYLDHMNSYVNPAAEVAPVSEPIQETQASEETVSDDSQPVQNVVENQITEEYTGGEETGFTPAAQHLHSTLSSVDQTDVDGLRYTIKQDKKTGKFYGNIKVIPSSVGGVPIENARSTRYSSYTPGFATREEALNDLVTVAQNSGLIKEDTNNGRVVEEVSDQGRVLEPDAPGQSDGGLLDAVASENVQADENQGDPVPDVEGEGRESAGTAGGTDAGRDGRGRSLGSDQGADLQPEAGGERGRDGGDAGNGASVSVDDVGDDGGVRDVQEEAGRDRAGESESVTEEATEDGREEVSDSGDAESAGRVEPQVGSGKESNLERCESRIRETLQKRAPSDHRSGTDERDSGRVETREARDAFEDRVRSEGFLYVETSTQKEALAFKVAAEQKWNTNAKTAAEKLESWGFDVLVFDGKVFSNGNGVTEAHEDAFTLLDSGNVTIFLSAELSADGMETAFHEGFHAARFGTMHKYRNELMKVIANGVNADSDNFETFVNFIADTYSYTESNVTDDSFTEEIIEEFYAWCIGKSHAAGDDPLRMILGLFSDVDSLGSQIDAIYAKMETTEEAAEDGTAIHPEERGATVRDVQESHSVHDDLQGVSAGDSQGDQEGRLGSQGELSGGQRDSVRSEEPGETGDAPASEEQSEVTAEVEQKTELATQELPRGMNFSIPEGGLKLPKGEKARFKVNVEAIKTLRTLMAEDRRATPEEQEILSKYVGWGGLANAFDEKKADWAKEYKQLKSLLTDKEYASARGSTLNAHYTEVGVIRSIYNGLAGLGFKGGRLLEPSAGIGHFAGAMPQELAAGVTSWTMVELDELTGNIAKYLYPNADVRVQGFETAKIPDNYMDMAISNVPFGNYGVVDKSYPKSVTGAIHNYFFAKALDKVRPGGLVTFITSRYTMDAQDSSVRQYIAQRADLLGAIRLPDTAFKSNANTEVVTDILVLKKREPGTKYGGVPFEKTSWHHTNLSIYEQTNDYFAEHPEMVLGTPESTGSMYRGNSLTYKAKPGNLTKQIEKAFASIEGKMDYPVQRTQEEIRAEIKADAGKVKNGAIVKKDGKLYRNNNGVLEAAEDVSKANEAAMSSIIELRDVGRELLNMQLDDVDEAQIKATRKKLNTLYDAFVKKYGILNSQKNKRLINMDIDAPFILALENYDKDTKTAKKADIFTKNTITPVRTVTSVNTVEEGLIVSMNETGGVDTARIAQLLGESEETVTRALLDNRLAFKNRYGKLETAEKYLSGNVKAKLRDAEALAEGDSDYTANVEELRKIIPEDIAAEDISVQPGATWIPDSVYSDFVAETLGTSNSEWRKSASVTYNKLLGTFSVTINDARLKYRPENTSTWGTPERSFVNIFEATLNSKSVTVTRKLDDGSRLVDKQATAAAQEKQEKIRAEFQRWMWADDNRKETMARLYNDMFNNYVTPKYDGSNLIVNGSNAAKPLRPHQRDAVQRVINSGGNTLLAHKVGAGKTYEMAAAAMKLRQLGIVKKPMFVVPKSLVAQWGNEFLDFFPAAKVLVLGEKDFSEKNRKLFANRIATGDYDAVILSQEQFKAVPMSVENQEAFYQEQIDALELSMEEAARANGKRDPSIKQMERSKKSFEAKLKRLADMKKDEDNIDFEQLGVDALFVDEAHSYKNLFYTTNMNNVSGLGNKEGSQKAFDLFMKVRYLQSLNGGRGIVFATATPVMNSMSEMYIMQKYLQSDLLEARGLHSFDAWANQFGEVRTVLEMNPSGKGFRQKQSFSRFKNLAELQQMFRAFADVLTEIPGLAIPTMKEGKRIIVESEPSEFQLAYIDSLAERADAIKNRKVRPEEDNMLKITSEGRKLSYTQRMIDPTMPYEDDNKIMKCADNVLNIWKESKRFVGRDGETYENGTQLIFCDLSTPKGATNTETTTETAEEVENISIYDDIRNVLVGAGVPAKEIAFIHDANTNEKKEKLFKDVNEGKVRVLIGSTGKMGVGMNAQQRIVALHHLDAPWRPGDIEQREGRALRQGNKNDEVGMYVYVTKQTFDSRMWDNLQRKASFIHQVMAGDLTARESEGDGDFALSAAEIKAISSGNPLIMEQFEVAAELSKLENLERAHAKEVSEAKRRIEKAKVEIASDEMAVERLQADLAARQDTSGDKFKLTIGKKTYAERKDAGEALIAEAKKRLKIVRDVETTEEIGSFAGFRLFATNSGDVLLRGKGQYRAAVNMESAMGTATRLEEAVKRLDNMLANANTRLAENKQAITKLEKTMAAPFDKADQLLELRKRNAAILAELNPDDEKNAAELSSDDEADTDNMVDLQVSSGIDHSDQWTAERVGDANKTPKRLSEIMEDIRHDFGLNITTGHIRGAGVRGQYNRNDRGIRSKIANDLPTVAHELGHHLDTVYGLTDETKLTDELKQELLDGMSQEMKDAYAEDRWPREGLAEYIRKFLQNREVANIDYPKFTKYFLTTLSAKDAALIEQLADEVNAYYSLDADTATSSIRLREEGAPDARTIREKIEEGADVLYQAMVDSNHAIKRFDHATGSNSYKLASNAAYSDAMAEQIITGDLTDANGQYVSPGLKTALHGLNLKDKKEYRLFGEYLTVKHGPERLAEGMRVFADDRKNSTAFMNRRQAELEAQYPQFEEISKRLYQFIRDFHQTWGVDTGLIGQEVFDSWLKRWDFYVPFNRAVSEEKRGIGAKRGFANQNSTIKKARGSGLDIVHPVDNLVNNMVKMVNAGVRNNVMRSITDSAQALGANAVFMEKVPAPVKVTKMDMTGVKDQLTTWLEDSDLDAASKAKAGGIVSNLDDILFQYGRGKAYGDVITVLNGGDPEFWKINDPQMLQSLTNLTPQTRGGILDAYSYATRFMTANITGNNVIWSLFSNMPRDLMTFFTYSKSKNLVKLAAGMGSAYINKVKGDHASPLYKEFLALGGGRTGAYSADRHLAKKVRKSLSEKKIDLNPMDWIAFVSDTVESGPRFATYKLMREAGMNPQEAFYEAMDITVNFRRSGIVAREMNKVIPFFNAGVQGLDKFPRWITAEDLAGKPERTKVAASRMTFFLVISAALAALTHAINTGDEEKEEEYEHLSTYTKNSYWNIPLGDGKYFAIPKPRELGVLSSLFERCLELGIGKNEHAFDEFFAYASENCLPSIASDLAQIPSNGIADSMLNVIGSMGLFGTFAYLSANKDFLGRPIVSSGLQNLEPEDQYTQKTSKIAYWLGQAFGGSPQQIDYFFQQVLGGWWKYQKALWPVGEQFRDPTLGVQNTYVKDNLYSTDIVNWLYDRAEETSTAKASDKANMDKVLAATWDSKMTDFYGTYYKLAKDKEETTASRGTRQLVLDMIYEYQRGIDNDTTTKAQDAVEDVCRELGSTEYLPAVMQAEVKDGKGAKHSLTDVRYVDYQTEYLRYYWATAEAVLPQAKTTEEKAAVFKAAKDVAKEEATNRELALVGAPKTAHAEKYKGLKPADVVWFKALVDLANDDGGLKQEEVIEIIEKMDLSGEQSYTLFRSRYDSDKNNPWKEYAP